MLTTYQIVGELRERGRERERGTCTCQGAAALIPGNLLRLNFISEQVLWQVSALNRSLFDLQLPHCLLLLWHCHDIWLNKDIIDAPMSADKASLRARRPAVQGLVQLGTRRIRSDKQAIVEGSAERATARERGRERGRASGQDTRSQSCHRVLPPCAA